MGRFNLDAPSLLFTFTHLKVHFSSFFISISGNVFACVHGSSKSTRIQLEESLVLFLVMLMAAAVLVAHVCVQ